MENLQRKKLCHQVRIVIQTINLIFQVCIDNNHTHTQLQSDFITDCQLWIGEHINEIVL